MMHAVPERQAFLTVALGAAAAALVAPSSLHLPPRPHPVAAALRVQVTAPHRALSAGRAFEEYRAAARPPLPAASPGAAPQFSDDVESARVIPSPRPAPPSAPARPAAPVQAPEAPSPAYTDLPSASGAYGSAQAYAESLVGATQFGCLKALWDRESGWDATAENSSSGAYGIPQALPGSKMASAGPDWAADADTQVRWGVEFYIEPVYGSPCGAWAHEEAQGWYLAFRTSSSSFMARMSIRPGIGIPCGEVAAGGN
jgi:hypothetical protein